MGKKLLRALIKYECPSKIYNPIGISCTDKDELSDITDELINSFFERGIKTQNYICVEDFSDELMVDSDEWTVLIYSNIQEYEDEEKFTEHFIKIYELMQSKKNIQIIVTANNLFSELSFAGRVYARIMSGIVVKI